MVRVVSFVFLFFYCGRYKIKLSRGFNIPFDTKYLIDQILIYKQKMKQIETKPNTFNKTEKAKTNENRDYEDHLQLYFAE